MGGGRGLHDLFATKTQNVEFNPPFLQGPSEIGNISSGLCQCLRNEIHIRGGGGRGLHDLFATKTQNVEFNLPILQGPSEMGNISSGLC